MRITTSADPTSGVFTVEIDTSNADPAHLSDGPDTAIDVLLNGVPMRQPEP